MVFWFLTFALCAVFVAARYYQKPIKRVLQDFLRDVRELCLPVIGYSARLWKWAGPRVTNNSTWAALVVNFSLYWPQISSDPAMAKFLADHPYLYLAGAIVALLASRRPGTPHQLPPAEGGLIDNAALV